MTAQAPASGARRPRGIVPCLLFGVLACVYAASYSGTSRLDDEHILLARTQSLALRGAWDEPQVYGNARVRLLQAQGDQATQVEPLYTLLGSLLYRLGVATGSGGAQSAFTLNLILVPVSAVMVYASVIVLGSRTHVAVICSLLFGLGTMAWPYATTYVRDVLAMTFASTAFLGWSLLLAKRRRRQRTGGVLLVLSLAGGVFSKNTLWAVALSLLVAGTAWIVLSRAEGRIRRLLTLAGGVLGVGLLVLVMPTSGPLARFSAAYYRHLASHFGASLRPDLVVYSLGPLLSPAKSIFLFSPPAALGLMGALRTWRSHWRFNLPALLAPLLLGLAQALFYRERWAGSFGWGLRYMLPALPPLAALSAPVVDRWLGSRAGRVGLWTVAVASAAIQVSGAGVRWGRVYTTWSSQGLDPYHPMAAWDPRFLAIPGQLAALGSPASWTVAWLRLMGEGVSWAIAVPLAALLIGLGLTALLWSHLRAPLAPGWRTAGTGLALAAAVAVIVGLPRGYRADPAYGGDRPEFREFLETWEQAGAADDGVILDSYGTPLWSFLVNHWTSEAVWYALAFEIPGSPEAPLGAGSLPSETSLDLFRRLQSPTRRLWYVSSSDAPDDGLGREAAWLDSHFDLEAAYVWRSAAAVEARIYSARDP